ncbi:ThuA domain-containing protein [Zhongshania sp.]|uniref:ThuA domain-containing protein n=1 Tax=Zhongshania sp. TaxID=1971902 RepID=UPI003568AC48
MNRVIKNSLWGLLSLTGIILLGLTLWIGPMVYRSLVGLKVFEFVPPELPANLDEKAILIFSKTNGFRDDKQIATANAVLTDIAQRSGWTSYVTENGAVFNQLQLQKFRAVVWNNVSGNVLTKDQREAFKAWIEQGGGFVGLHGAGGDPSYDWQWYEDELIGAKFNGHTLGPQIQEATLLIENSDHPVTVGLDKVWVRSDEWYSFVDNPRDKGYQILITIDESSYLPVEGLLPFIEPKDIRMGADHPLVWSHCVGKGRALYSALGHTAASYEEPEHQQLLAGAISWAAGFAGQVCPE